MTARFSASSMEKFMNCHASANLELAIPNWTPPVEDRTVSNAANRGSKMHEIFAEIVSLPPNDRQNFLLAAEYVDRTMKTRRFKRLVEESATADWLDSAPNTTADLVLYVQDEIHIFDLKTGKTYVEAVGNKQMLFYAATYAPLAPKANFVTLHIVQPWANNITAWQATAADIQMFMVEARAAEEDIALGDTTFNPGDHCMFCPANPRGRGSKGTPACPPLMQVWYSSPVDDEAILEEGE